MIVMGAMIFLLRSLEPYPGSDPDDISNWLDDGILWFVRRAIVCLVFLWCVALIAFFASLRRTRTAA